MASQTLAKRLRALAKSVPHSFHTEATVKVLTEQDNFLADAALALLCATMLERTLEASLLSIMRPLNANEIEAMFIYEKRGPLSDFSSKIKAGYALRLFGPKTKDDLDSIRIIRNLFAHMDKHYDFSSVKEISEICENLNLLSTISVFGSEYPMVDSRGKFLSVASTIANRLPTKIEAQQKPRSLANLLLPIDHVLP